LQPLLKLHIMKITQMLSLGKSYAFTLCIFLFSTFIFGQTTLVHYKFENNLNPQAGAIGNPILEHLGGAPTYYNNNGNRLVEINNPNKYLELTIDTSGQGNLNLNFYSVASLGFFSLYANWVIQTNTGQGDNFVTISTISVGYNGGTYYVSLPANAAKNNLKVRILYDSGLWGSDKLRMDDLKLIVGTPNITVYNSANSIIEHESSPTPELMTDFGTRQTTDNALARTFTVRNYMGTQNSILSVNNIVVTGAHASDFFVNKTSLNNIGVNQNHTGNPSDNFNISFLPTEDGIRTAQVLIYSNTAPSPYVINVIGVGASCSLETTTYAKNSMGGGEQTLESNFTANDLIGGNACSPTPSIGRLYPSSNVIWGSSCSTSNSPNLYTSSTSSLLIRGTTPKLIEFGGASGIDISSKKNVSIQFNIAAFTVNNVNGLTKDAYIELEVWNPSSNSWSKEIILKGADNNNHYRYDFSGGSQFLAYYDGDNNPATKSNTNSTKYKKVRLNFPSSTAFSSLKFRIRAATNAESTLWLIDDVSIVADNAIFKTYTNAGWSPSAPTSTQKAIFQGNYTVPSNGLSVCECEVMENGSVTIPANTILTVKGKIINHKEEGDNFIVRNDGNIIQTEREAVNVGKITVFRESKEMVRQDATFWSSPVEGQNLRNFSPGTLLKRFYLYNKYTEAGATSDYKSILEYDPSYPMPNPIPEDWYEEGELSGNVFNPNTYTFKKGWGYTIRVPNNWHQTNPSSYEGKFVGTPHNGDIEVPVYGKFTVVGNPYPSNISYHAFMDFNQDVNSIHFWTHKFPVGSDYYDYGYLTVNKMGTTGLYPNPEGGDSITVNYNATIKVGQGFLVRNSALANTQTEWSVKFNNLMRIPSTGGVFYKNFDEPEAHKFWLGLYDQQGEKMAQILLGYMESATNGFDKQYDAERMGSSPLYSLMDEGKMAIQARALPFNHNDVILLGFVAKNNGSFRITLDDMTGLFAEGQEILIKDKVANIVHNLSLGDYTFDANQGTYNHRFEIIYKKKPSFIKSISSVNNIEINKINHQIEINSSIDKITSIQVFNISGRLLMEENDINKLNYTVQTSGIEPSIIIVRGITETGETFNRKFIIN
jgi:hypothetical protein